MSCKDPAVDNIRKPTGNGGALACLLPQNKVISPKDLSAGTSNFSNILLQHRNESLSTSEIVRIQSINRFYIPV